MNRETMTIAQAERAISSAEAAGRISCETARSVRIAIRDKSCYGMSMTTEDRARIVRIRYGIEG